MNTQLSPQQMLDQFNIHAEAEFVGDIDTTMATVSDHPVFEWGCMDMRIEGQAAVREVYLRLFVGLMPKMVEAGRRMFAFGENTLWFESIFGIVEDDGIVRKHSSLAVVNFEVDPIKIAGEYTYGSPGFVAHARAAMGEDVMDIPGVSVLDRSQTPLIVKAL